MQRPTPQLKMPLLFRLIVVGLMGVLCLPALLDAQNEENPKPNPLKITGTLGLNTGFYNAIGAQNRQDPFQYLISANINFRILDLVDVPFSANLSQQEANFRQPFNQYGISPNYKWATGHLGFRNLTFSDFTLAGHTFLGAGVELKPGNWDVAAMYGRFRRPVDEVLAFEEGVDPAYRRLGYGAKIGYRLKQDRITFSFLKVRDDTASIPSLIENDQVTPEENLVMSLGLVKKFGKKVELNLEGAQSALTTDIRSNANPAQSDLRFFGPFFNQRASSHSKFAYKGSLNYKAKTFKVGLNYRHIDTDYRTLGAYFFNNDIEEATLKLSSRLLKGKVNFSGQLGGQRNNLLADKATRSSRIIGSVNVAYAPAPGMSIAVNFSNFSSFLRVQRDILSDSLNFYQVTRNTGLNVAKNFGTKERSQGLAFSASYQNAVGRQEYSIDPDSKTDFVNLAVSHRYKLKAKDLGLSSAMSFAHSINPTSNTTFFGPVFGINKGLLDKKIKVNVRTSYQQVLINGSSNSAVWTNAANSSYTLKEKHTFSLGLQYLNKFSMDPTVNGFSEIRGNFGYTYPFGK